MSDPTKARPPLEAPWEYTREKGAVYCLFSKCPEGIKSQLKPTSGSKFADEKYRYSVVVYDTGEPRVYRNEKGKQNHSSAEVAAAIRDQTVILQAILVEQKRIVALLEARKQ